MNVRNEMVAARWLAQLSTYYLINSNADVNVGITGGRSCWSDLDHEAGSENFIRFVFVKQVHLILDGLSYESQSQRMKK